MAIHSARARGQGPGGASKVASTSEIQGLGAGMSMGMVHQDPDDYRIMPMVHQDLDSSMIMVMAYIVSTNIMRRSLTAGQRAMAYALVYPEATNKGGRGKKLPNLVAEFSGEYVRRARAILNWLICPVDAISANSARQLGNFPS